MYVSFLQDSDFLVITILDENDNRPIFTVTNYRAEVVENSAAGNVWVQSTFLVVALPGTVQYHSLHHFLNTFSHTRIFISCFF